jgi:solute carrier family 35 protein F5
MLAPGVSSSAIHGEDDDEELGAVVPPRRHRARAEPGDASRINDGLDGDAAATTMSSDEARERLIPAQRDVGAAPGHNAPRGTAARNDDNDAGLTGDAAADPRPSPVAAWLAALDCRRLSRHGVGVALIVLVAFIWVASSEMLQFVFDSADFNSPFFVTYFNTMSFALWSFGFACPGASGFGANPWDGPAIAVDATVHDADAAAAAAAPAGAASPPSPQTPRSSVAAVAAPPGARRAMSDSPQGRVLDDAPPAPAAANDDDSAAATVRPGQHAAAAGAAGEPVAPYPVKQIAAAAFVFCPLWFLANVLFNYSLKRTSVASNTILSATSTIWATLLSRVLLREAITLRKLAAVALAMAGAVMVGFGDESASASAARASLVGNILAGVSAFFYSAYTTVLRAYLPDERRYPIGMCFAFVGVFNALLLWPGMIIVNYVGLEPFRLPSPRVAGFLVLNGLLGTNLSDILWAKSVILTSPVVATLGLSLTIPIAMLADFLLRGATHSALYMGGTACVTVAFIVANLNGA